MLRKLLNEDIIGTIESSKQSNKITSEDAYVLIGLLNKIYEHLYGNVKLLKEEKVKEMLADRMVLEFEEVREKTTIELVTNMINAEFPIEKISLVTKLPQEKIEQIQEQMNKAK